MESESGLPYFELGFSPEDFTIAGYSVLGGDHLDDVEQAAAALMPGVDTIDRDYTGWSYDRSEIMDRVDLIYHFEQTGRGLGIVSYEIDSGIAIDISVQNFSDDGFDGLLSVNEFPLYEGKVGSSNIPADGGYYINLQLGGMQYEMTISFFDNVLCYISVKSNDETNVQ